MSVVAQASRPRMAFPVAHIEPSDQGWNAASRRLAAALVARFNSPFYRPPVLPPVAAKLLELSQAPDIDLDEVLQLLQHDGLLAGRILRLVQSPLYRPIDPVRTLREAVVRLGVNRVRDFVMAEVLHLRVFRTSPFRSVMDRLRRHALAVAQISEAIARMTGVHPEEAFLCGLLHDIGIAGCIMAGCEDSRMTAWMSPGVAMPVIDELHSDAGAIIATMWKLPPAVREVITYHHKGEPKAPRISHTAVVMVADALAGEFGAGLHDPTQADTAYLFDRADREALSEAQFFLGLRPRELQSLRVDAVDIIESINEELLQP